MKKMAFLVLPVVLLVLGFVLAVCKIPRDRDRDNGTDATVNVPGTSLVDKLAWLQNSASSNGTYVIDVTADESISPHTLLYSGKMDISITIRGSGGQRTISLSRSGAMFTISTGVTLVLDRDITLKGVSGNNSALVGTGTSSSKLIMNAGAKITDNTNTSTSGSGGGVYIGGGGAFTMDGGEISNNRAVNGGGVYVYSSFSSSYFNIYGGTVSGNTATGDGGGVYVYSSYAYYSSSSYFNMHGGTVSGNTATGSGGGVYVYAYSSSYSSSSSYFNMYDGTISGNDATTGGGVYTRRSGGDTYFRINNGVVYGSDAAGDLANTGTDAALHKDYGSVAQHGTFDSNGNNFTSLGNIPSTSDTIRVVSGNWQ